LRKVERIGSFDVAGTHVVADGVADDFAARVDGQREFGFGNGPGGVAPDLYGAVGSGDLMGDGFEEEFGALGGVDAVVEIAASGIFGFGDARSSAVVVGDA